MRVYVGRVGEFLHEFFAGIRREDAQGVPRDFNEGALVAGIGVDVGSQAGVIPGLRKGGHAPAAAQGTHLGGVPVDQGGGAAVEGVQIGALEEFRRELPGIEGNAFHAHSMGGGASGLRGSVRDMKGAPWF